MGAYIVYAMEEIKMSDDVLAKWNDLKLLVEALEVDVAKNARGVGAAGVRARKGLRTLQAKSKELVKLTIELEKSSKTAAEQPAPPAEEKPAKKSKK